MEPDAYYNAQGVPVCPYCDDSLLAGSKVPVPLIAIHRKGLLWFKRTVGMCPRCWREFWVRLP